MTEDIIKESQSLPRVINFFHGKRLPENFAVPSDILLYCHDYEHPRTIISSRYMLIIPYTEITYIIEDIEYKITPDQAILVKPYLHRSVPDRHRDYLRLIVSFELETQQGYLPDNILMEINPKAWMFIKLLLEQYKNDEVTNAIFTLVLLLEELSKNPVGDTRQLISPRIRNVMSIINQFLDQAISIKDLAATVNLSPSHLRRVFREETGMSLGKYLERRRIGAAQRLLADTSLKIEQISRECGYDSIYSFSRFFKNSTGIPPLQFRKKYGKNKPTKL